MYKIIETHCHLDYLKLPLEEVLSNAKQAGVDKILTIAVGPENFDAVKDLAETYDNVFFTQGIHPHDAKLCTPDALTTIEQRCSETKMLAVGEIGLDYHYDNSPRDIQREVFKQQLEIAIKNKKPVVIHSRDADDDMIDILKEYAPQLEKKGVVHSFTSGKVLAQTALDLGFHLGFNGIITFKKAQNVRDIVELCPLNRILLETDAPFLTPIPFRGKENAPDKLIYILEKVAEIKKVSPTEVEKTCYQNSINLFSF